MTADVFYPSQGGDLCSPEGRTCIEENSRRNFSCSVNCEGMYTDIQKTQEDKVEREKFDILELEEQSEKGSVQSAVAKVQGKEDDSNKKKISKLVKK